MQLQKRTVRRGFTLIELLLVMGIIGSLSSITILSVNPQKQIEAAKDSARRSVANQIAKALTQYYIDNSAYPSASISATTYAPTPICTQGVTGDSTCVNIDSIVPLYMASLPRESIESTANYSGYTVYVYNGRIDVVPTMKACKEIHVAYPNAPGGKYSIFGRFNSGFSVYCDMTSDGGGWTIVNAVSGADGEQPIVSDTSVTTGNPLNYDAFNLTRSRKLAINAVASETLIKRSAGTWIKMSAPAFDSNLGSGVAHPHKQVIITANDGTVGTGYMGYSDFAYVSGGDFGVVTSSGFDHHNPIIWNHLNTGCANSYFYSYSATADSDAGYDVSLALGSWTITSACESGEGGTTKFYLAMR